jgi:hypothetical protein
VRIKLYAASIIHSEIVSFNYSALSTQCSTVNYHRRKRHKYHLSESIYYIDVKSTLGLFPLRRVLLEDLLKSAEPHRNKLHQGRFNLARFVEYLAGRASGLLDPFISLG